MNYRRLVLPAALAGAVALLVFALPRGRAPVADREEAAPADSLAADRPSLEIAGAHILIAHRDSRPPVPGVTRTPVEARDLAVRLATEILDQRATFADVARRYSDDARTARKGGGFGIVRSGQLPLPLELTLSLLEIGQVHPGVETPAGVHVLMRLPVRRAACRHIMITWQGAGGDGGAVARSRAQARILADEIAAKARIPDADFCALAARFSDDEGSRFECGWIGIVEPGELETAFETALFDLAPGGVSGVVETSFGFHIVMRDAEPRE